MRTSSVYTLVASLRDAGWITPAGAPEPVTFQLTADGTAEFRRRVVADIGDADPANTGRFITALAYVGILDRAEAVATLTARTEALRKRADDLDRAVEMAGVAPIYMIEASFFASQTRHDIDWLGDLIDRVRDPEFEWPR